MANSNPEIARDPENQVYYGSADNQYDHIISDAARLTGVDPREIKTIISKESGFDPKAIGCAGEYGLGQIKDGTVSISEDAHRMCTLEGKIKDKSLEGNTIPDLMKEKSRVDGEAQNCSGERCDALKSKSQALEKKLSDARAEVSNIKAAIHRKIESGNDSRAIPEKTIREVAKRMESLQKRFEGPHRGEKVTLAYKFGAGGVPDWMSDPKRSAREWPEKIRAGAETEKTHEAKNSLKNKADTITGRLDHRAEHMINYSPYKFEGYVKVTDANAKKGNMGSQDKPYILAVHANEKGERIYTNITNVEGRKQGFGKRYDNLDDTGRLTNKKGERPEISPLAYDRTILAGDERRRDRKPGSAENPYNISVYKDANGKEIYITDSRDRDKPARPREYSTDQRSLEKRLLGKDAVNKGRVITGEGKTPEEARQRYDTNRAEKGKEHAPEKPASPEGPGGAGKERTQSGHISEIGPRRADIKDMTPSAGGQISDAGNLRLPRVGEMPRAEQKEPPRVSRDRFPGQAITGMQPPDRDKPPDRGQEKSGESKVGRSASTDNYARKMPYVEKHNIG